MQCCVVAHANALQIERRCVSIVVRHVLRAVGDDIAHRSKSDSVRVSSRLQESGQIGFAPIYQRTGAVTAQAWREKTVDLRTREVLRSTRCSHGVKLHREAARG